jgi:hypothetical protein
MPLDSFEANQKEREKGPVLKEWKQKLGHGNLPR